MNILKIIKYTPVRLLHDNMGPIRLSGCFLPCDGGVDLFSRLHYSRAGFYPQGRGVGNGPHIRGRLSTLRPQRGPGIGMCLNASASRNSRAISCALSAAAIYIGRGGGG